MQEKFDSRRPFGGRAEYRAQSMEDKLDECLIVTDMLDELLGSAHDSGGDIATAAHADASGLSQFRSFRYLDADPGGSYGYSWPLVEKTVDIRYVRSRSGLSTEQYQVAVATRVHQIGVSQDPILNVYQLSYFGTDRQSADVTVDEPDIADASEFNYVTRPATPYDHAALFDELSRLTDMLDAQARENSYLGKAS